jgi:hypothetical protein
MSIPVSSKPVRLRPVDTPPSPRYLYRMHLLRSGFTLGMLLALAGGGPRVSGGDFVLFKNIWGDVIVATDTTAAGKALTLPTPQQPVYYLGMSLGCKLGSIPGDYEPDVKKLNRFVADVIAKQGYLDARLGAHDPSLFLVVQWGYLKPGTGDLLWFLGYDASQDIAAPAFPGQLGPEIWRRNFRSREIETILDDAKDAIYGIIVTAFEYKSASTAQPIAYWQTRIGLSANRKSMAEALPTMLAAAGPAIGRPSDKPLLVDADLAREGRVKLGELKIIDFGNDLPAPGATDGEKK